MNALPIGTEPRAMHSLVDLVVGLAGLAAVTWVVWAAWDRLSAWEVAGIAGGALVFAAARGMAGERRGILIARGQSESELQ